MPREGFTPEDITYDFKEDVWIKDPVVHSRWNFTELPKPATSPKPGVWFRKPLRRPRARGFGLIALSATVALPLVPLIGWIVLAPVLLAVGTVAIVKMPSFEPEASPEDVRLMEHPDDPDVCLVELTIWRNGSPTGRDHGVAWFDRGRLLFSGHATSFAIGGEDVLPRSQWPRESEDGRIGTLHPLAIPLRVPWGSATLSFIALPHGAEWKRQESRFFERVRVFRARPPQSGGPRQWPPLEP